jgi:transcriptional regulator with PAS, ATPase and Fis domain
VNCATLSPTLLESELFGHKRGAFTGAIRDHPGLFRAAHRGSLLLDEVAEIPLDLQGRLLRVLQEKTFLPLGETQAVSVDVRIIAATNRSLRQEVAAGRFREDLIYRIRVVPVYVPPLRDRPDDVEALFWHFVNETNGHGLRMVEAVTRRALRAILRYHWPGNVRVLQSMVQHAFAVEEGPVLDLVGLTPEVRGDRLPDFEAPRPMQRSEKERIRSALARNGQNKSSAAGELGMSRQTLWRKMTMYGLR